MAGSGGAWKVAYADFVTAMMAFFMVMWLTSQSADVKEAVAEHFRNPGGKRISGSDAKSIFPSNQNGNGQRRQAKLRGTKKSEGTEKYQKMADEGERTNVGTTVSFALNSVQISENGIAALTNLLPELEGKTHRVEVRGHSAASGSSSPQATMDAWNISYKRSIEVMKFLVDSGIDPRRIRLSQAGNSEPKFTATDIDHSGDSRVEVFLLNETFEEPSATSERLVGTKSLDSEAARLDAEESAAAANVPASGH